MEDLGLFGAVLLWIVWSVLILALTRHRALNRLRPLVSGNPTAPEQVFAGAAIASIAWALPILIAVATSGFQWTGTQPLIAAGAIFVYLLGLPVALVLEILLNRLPTLARFRLIYYPLAGGTIGTFLIPVFGSLAGAILAAVGTVGGLLVHGRLAVGLALIGPSIPVLTLTAAVGGRM